MVTHDGLRSVDLGDREILLEQAKKLIDIITSTDGTLEEKSRELESISEKLMLSSKVMLTQYEFQIWNENMKLMQTHSGIDSIFPFKG